MQLLVSSFKKANKIKIIFKYQLKMSSSKNLNVPDPRMTEESRKFISKFSKLMDRKLYKELNLNEIRSLIDTSTFMLNNKFKSENVIEKEYFVQNSNDNYSIPVTAYIPNDVNNLSPIVIYFHGGGWTICNLY